VNGNGAVERGRFSRSIFPKFDFRVTLHGTADFAPSDDFMPNIYVNAVKEGLSNFFRKITMQTIKPLTYTYFYHPNSRS